MASLHQTAALATRVGASPVYTAASVGYFPGASVSQSASINSNGDVAGLSGTNFAICRGFRYRTGTLMDLGVPAGSESSFVQSINASGGMAGEAYFAGGKLAPYHVTVTSGHATWTRLAGANNIKVFGSTDAINDAGDIVGDTWDAHRNDVAAVWKKSNGYALTRPSLPSHTVDSFVSSIDNSGDMVGKVETVTKGVSTWQADFWGPGGQRVALPNLPGYSASTVKSVVRLAGSTKSVEIAGSVFKGDAESAAIWKFTYVKKLTSAEIGGPILLGSLKGFPFGVANAVNSAGQVAGSVYNSAYKYVAFLWDGGKLYDANKLIPSGSGWTLHEAFGINAAGDLVGGGSYNGAQTTGFILTPK